ncbi:MAG: hypothetical protein B7Y07_04525 [Halothiobacillus sp. 24-54-40]|jgi:hypothetical protein|nr:MAG: hypothetical protein B7Y58_04585 [Halothiobacillus sp. 35-54-62]OYZ87330.1 MAG: hypothetical protein B7Y07_04525 [Halothiobacillus sp. 24-54-40]OZA80489.1 MAG: hypothetical protein B7X64_05735 [Halothiobacillus sp. 39-53-45]
MSRGGFVKNPIVIEAVRNWVLDVVITLNLCPFAKRELVKNRVRFELSIATDEEQLLQDLEAALRLMQHSPEIETTLLIHPDVLQHFFDFNQFLARADSRLAQLKLKGIFQIASFHPDYQFGGTQWDDAENFTNKSPYPVLHILREASLDAAIANYPEVDLIPERNIALLEHLGSLKLTALLHNCTPSGARLGINPERTPSE